MTATMQAGASTTENAIEPDGVLDLVHLRSQTLNDSQLAREVLHLFLGQAATILNALSAEQADATARREAAHALVGSARGIGAFGVARAAREIELAAGSADIAALEAEVDKARRVIEAYLSTG
jgi:HPt (histidine-containing phosphotransfer) domain-containing protein